ncbi:MAG: hypothetical protein KC800_19485 [Candidatus Eremiobacteraeota bacterium]|nr:hypothetical protein [Candidatus Eremiobacteraeota bacterium]
MQLPESAAEAAKWLLLVGLAFFAADATSALIGRSLAIPERPLPPAVVNAVLEDVPAQAAPPGLVSLLRTTEPKGGLKQDDSAEPTVKGKKGQTAPVPGIEQIKLQGTMAAANGAGLAILEYQGSSQVVSSGDQIGGFTLKSVTSYSATLEGQGQTYLLSLNSEQSTSTAVAPNRPAVSQPTEQPSQPEEVSEAPEEQGSTAPILTMDELRNILDNPEKFMGQGFTAKPEVVDGVVQGMRIKLANPSHPLARLGIRDGDLVKSLNGTALEGPESLSMVYRVLRNSSTLRFEVGRNGQDETVEVQLEE